MAVLQREELEQSPLADLHAIASELGLEGFRSMRKADLVAAILDAQGGDEPQPPPEAAEDQPAVEEEEPPPPPEEEPEVVEEPVTEEETAAGVLDVLPNGSGFIRVDPGGQSRDDIYVSPAQIRRCELRAGDEVSGPVRPPRRNERHPSLSHVEAVNGSPAEPPEERPRFGSLTAVFPTEKLTGPPALEGVPFGKGSRVVIGGPPGAGATTLLRQVAEAIGSNYPDIQLAVVLVGARPEEVTEWRRDLGVPVSGGAFDRSLDAQAQVAELAVERAKRTVERGGHAAVVIDSLEPLSPGAQRRALGAARNTEEGGSLTVVAAIGMAWEPQRFATTKVMLDPPEGGESKVSAARSGTLRAELLS
jgi:transcription termination factor Rho